jgi:nitric oxide reductase large subunit
MYIKLFDYIGEGRAYLTVLYNICSVILLSVTLGLLMWKTTDLLSHESHKADRPGSKDRANN